MRQLARGLRAARAASTSRRTATSSRDPRAARRAARLPAPARARRDRAPGRAATACPSTCASPSALPAENERFLAALRTRWREALKPHDCAFEQARRHRRRADRRLVRAGAEARAGGAARRRRRAQRARNLDARAASCGIIDARRADAARGRRATPTWCWSRRRSAQMPRDASRRSRRTSTPRAVVTDAGSTKRDVIARRARALGASASPSSCPAHRSPGAEKSGAAAASRRAVSRPQAWC